MDGVKKGLVFEQRSGPARLIAVGALSCLVLVVSYFAGRIADLSADDPQYFGIAVSIALAFTCMFIVVQSRRLRRVRQALAELSTGQKERRNDDLVVAADDAPLVPTLETQGRKATVIRLIDAP